MTDKSYLHWPFLEDHHRTLARDLDQWAASEIPPVTESREAHQNIDETCRTLVRMLGQAGWLRYAVPRAFGGAHDELDVRSLCLIREILARYSGPVSYTPLTLPKTLRV